MVIWKCLLTTKTSIRCHEDTWSCITIVSIWWWSNDASRHHPDITGWCLQASSGSKGLKYILNNIFNMHIVSRLSICLFFSLKFNKRSVMFWWKHHNLPVKYRIHFMTNVNEVQDVFNLKPKWCTVFDVISAHALISAHPSLWEK